MGGPQVAVGQEEKERREKRGGRRRLNEGGQRSGEKGEEQMVGGKEGRRGRVSLQGKEG